MRKRQCVFHSEFSSSVQEAYAWCSGKGDCERFIPPWLDAIPSCDSEQVGQKIGMKLKWGPIRLKWILNRGHFIPNQEFSDEQIRGPFTYYLHRHRFVATDLASSQLIDEITYASPSHLLEKRIDKEFFRYISWRNAVLKGDLIATSQYPRQPLRILLSGSSGFIGSRLKIFLELAGHEVIRLVRNQSQRGEAAIFWDPLRAELKKEEFEGFDAVVHLAGAGVASARWTKRCKERLFLSRCRDTWLLSQILCRLYQPPRTVICASAVGYYGDRETEELTEESSKGEGFLADLCGKWEQATEAIENRGARVVHTRFGTVLGVKGGILRKMLGPFRWGLGGKMGSGQQIVSWIGIDDLLGSIYHCLMKQEIRGAVNVVAPKPVTQEELAYTFAKKLGRPALCHLPALILKLRFGDMAKELLLCSQNVKPTKLLETGYSFRYPDLDTALDFVM